MTCSACTIAAGDPMTGHFTAGCRDCAARALASSPIYAEASAADALTPGYRSALQQAFGEGWKSGHASVKSWAEKIVAAGRNQGSA